ncbi:MAG: hypothetical protein NWF04_10755 [Candidatus Bathyarchaeota archaeon]|nr:hypothetical protein [Candidatus Bathyarchaeota archaeon]
MNRNVALAVLALFVLCSSAFFSCTVAAEPSVGVARGDFFTYDFSAYFNTNNSEIPVPGPLVRDNQTQWLRYTVTSVDNFTVTYAITQHLDNGTEFTTTNQQADLATGEGGFPFLVTDLNANDFLYPDSTYSPIVNETLTRSYSQGTREINHAAWNETDYVDLYFDKATGVPVEFHVTFIVSAESQAQYSYILTDSSLWTIPELTPLTVALIAAATLTTALFYKKHQTKNQTRPT